MVGDASLVTLVVAGPRATITLNRPEQLNALSPALVAQALAASREVAARADIRVLVVRAEGRAFSAGVDLKALQSPDYTPAAARAFARDACDLALLWETMPQPVIARVAGYCFTGALELALGCDFIVAGEDAQFADTHAKLGFVPVWGLTSRLSRRIPLQRAKELSMTGRRMPATEAMALGLVLDVVPLADLDARVDGLVDALAAGSAGAIAACKDLYRRAQNGFLDQNLSHEAARLYTVADRAERQASVTSGLGSDKG